MGYYLALDGGGTKVAAILYDDRFEPVRTCVTGSLRGNTTRRELIERHAAELVEGLGLAGMRIEAVGGVCEDAAVDAMRRVCRIGRDERSDELELGLSAAGLFGDGLLALCGTGSTLFGRLRGRTICAGGYGAAVADEGSGYWIGREAFLAAIRAREGRGEPTALAEAIPRWLGFPDPARFREAIFSIYAVSERSPTASVARCVPLVVKAAAGGDAVAAGILRRAGRLMGEQMRYLIEANGVPDDLPAAVSGSVWRENPLLLDEFLAALRRQSPARPVILPRLEPVMGAVARKYRERTGEFTDETVRVLARRFPAFSYDVSKAKEDRTETGGAL